MSRIVPWDAFDPDRVRFGPVHRRDDGTTVVSLRYAFPSQEDASPRDAVAPGSPSSGRAAAHDGPLVFALPATPGRSHGSASTAGRGSPEAKDGSSRPESATMCARNFHMAREAPRQSLASMGDTFEAIDRAILARTDIVCGRMRPQRRRGSLKRADHTPSGEADGSSPDDHPPAARGDGEETGVRYEREQEALTRHTKPPSLDELRGRLALLERYWNVDDRAADNAALQRVALRNIGMALPPEAPQREPDHDDEDERESDQDDEDERESAQDDQDEQESAQDEEFALDQAEWASVASGDTISVARRSPVAPARVAEEDVPCHAADGVSVSDPGAPSVNGRPSGKVRVYRMPYHGVTYGDMQSSACQPIVARVPILSAEAEPRALLPSAHVAPGQLDTAEHPEAAAATARAADAPYTASAADTLTRLRERLCCPLCDERYGDARVLPACGHTFCAGCIERWCLYSRGRGIPCPLCRVTSAMPDTVLDLPRNQALQAVADLLCAPSDHVPQ